MNRTVIPIHLLSGFLGSGKTTFLTQLLERYKQQGLKPAVIMNELGDINLDGQLVSRDVPMAEMLSGCICCTIRGDLGIEISQLIDQYHPDVIIIESTGAANPLETIDGVTEAAMYKDIDLRSIITVVDGPELLARRRSERSETYQLMLEQIRSATLLLLNKSDRLEQEQRMEAEQLLRENNSHAPIVATVRCHLDRWDWLDAEQEKPAAAIEAVWEKREHGRHVGHGEQGHNMGLGRHGHNVEHGEHEHRHSHSGEHNHQHEGHVHEGDHVLHHSHSHVMSVTYYLQGAVNSVQFEQLLDELPSDIYRAKGIVSFSDTAGRYLFQYAYKQSDFMKIDPQGEVNDVAVFIGEHFSKEELLNKLAKLEIEKKS
ncbi:MULTISPECIES: CobW family GTP-binding protein [unclassified Paenibacillus]|uniref:CobW family GTP-binding protein n=1 Tax=unclassified Paenibacillus TaxID=185978 RepID=UPI002F407A94